MKNTTQEKELLLKLLQEKKEQIEVTTLETSSGLFSSFLSSYNSFFKILCSESIIKEDPYKDDYSLSTLEIPEESPIPHNEEEYELAIRLSHFQAILKYIDKEVEFTLQNLTPGVIDKIERLLKFIDWFRLFDPQPQGENTVALNKLLFLYQKDIGHAYVVSSLKSHTKAIDKSSNLLLESFEDLKLIQNETYKVWLRDNIFDKIKLPPELNDDNLKKAQLMVASKFSEIKKPLYKDLVNEVLMEDYSIDGDKLKKSIIDELSGAQESNDPNVPIVKKVDPKELLENTVLELYKISSQIRPIIAKVEENAVIHREVTYTFLEKIIDYIKYKLFQNERITSYVLSLKIEHSDDKEEKEVILEKFLTKFAALNTKLESYKNKDLPLFKALSSRDEEEINIFTHKLMSLCRYCYKVTSALDDFYKEDITNPRGTQVELKAIYSIINRAQILYQEYIDFKLEQSESRVEGRIEA